MDGFGLLTFYSGLKERTISASLSISCNPRTSTAEVEIHPDSTEKKGARPDFLEWNCISKTYMYIYIYIYTEIQITIIMLTIQ